MGKMINKITFISVCICFLSGMAFTSCSSDDDEGSASSDAGVMGDNAKVRVTQVGNYRFYYDEKGRIDHILDGSYEEYQFTYDPNKVISRDSEYDEGEDELSISYNSKGFVQKLDYSTSFTEGKYTYDIEGSSSYSYDGQGHLKQISSTIKEKRTGNGKASIEDGKYSTSFTWENDMLVSIYCYETESEDGETETSESTCTLTYATDNLENYLNKYYQYTPPISDQLEGVGDGELEEALAYLGVMGKGPKYLPISFKEKWEEYYDGETDSGSSTKTLKYGFNSNGTISYVTVNNSRYNYSYSYLQDEEESKSNMNYAPKAKDGKRKGIFRRLFSHSKTKMR